MRSVKLRTLYLGAVNLMTFRVT